MEGDLGKREEESNLSTNENHLGLGPLDGLDSQNINDKSKDDLKSNSDEDEKEDEWLDVLGSGQLLKKVSEVGPRLHYHSRPRPTSF